MAKGVNIDGVLVTWGDRLFYPGNRRVKGAPPPRLRGDALRRRAAAIRDRIAATVVRRVPQVMVKVTGGGRSMRAIAAHFRYISKNGKLEIEDDRGETFGGRRAVADLAEDWRFTGGLIPEDAEAPARREAFNIMLSMPKGTDPLAVQRAARQFARVELAGHKYVMVLHDHQANPHVHLSMKVESRQGRRLNPRKADLHRWRETFAEKLRDLGIEAEATCQGTRGQYRHFDPLWRLKARADGRLRNDSTRAGPVGAAGTARPRAALAWERIAEALRQSDDPSDVRMAKAVAGFVQERFAGPAKAPDQVPRVPDADQSTRR